MGIWAQVAELHQTRIKRMIAGAVGVETGANGQGGRPDTTQNAAAIPAQGSPAVTLPQAHIGGSGRFAAMSLNASLAGCHLGRASRAVLHSLVQAAKRASINSFVARNGRGGDW